MLRIFKTVDDKVCEQPEVTAGCWVALTNPSAGELLDISSQFQIDIDDLKAPLDEEERSRMKWKTDIR